MSRFATYVGERGRSLGAEDAESRGLLPMTRAVRALSEASGMTLSAARRLLRAATADEWHHTGLRARRTDYYDWLSVWRAVDATAADGYAAAVAARAEAAAAAARESTRARIMARLKELERRADPLSEVEADAERVARKILAVIPTVSGIITRRQISDLGIEQPRCVQTMNRALDSISRYGSYAEGLRVENIEYLRQELGRLQ
jgi:hypothetical protein